MNSTGSQALLARLLAACLLALCCVAPAQAQEAVYSADSVKAAYLFHFAGYVEWQPQSLPGTLTIGIIGDRGVAAELRRILPGRSIGVRNLKVREMAAADDLSGVQILFVGQDDTASIPALAEKARKLHIVLVSDDAGLDRGSVINFVTADRRVRFEISLRAAEQAGIKISSRLLSAALRLKRSFFTPRSALAHLGDEAREKREEKREKVRSVLLS
ncbi:MAG TPA: YfiR family protein [Burkholderiales bacterium]